MQKFSSSRAIYLLVPQFSLWLTVTCRLARSK